MEEVSVIDTRKTSTKKIGKKSRQKSQRSSKPAQINFPVVGIGASAGGLEAFTALLKALPLDTGMAFVLIQHLAPSHVSMLTELLGRATAMPVLEITEGQAVQPDHVYVIPPNANVGILHGVLHLLPRELAPGHYLPIDYFLRSLAQDTGSKAIGVILSGTASDGVLGLKEIKAAGGITFAQDEETAEYNGMPHSAIAAGCVDFVLPPAQIAAELAHIRRHPYLKGKKTAEKTAEENLSEEENNLSRIFLLLRQQTGNDFSHYKPSTIQRQIQRRMLLNKLDRIIDYIRHLERTPTEVDALFHDILIHVTGFFRDPEVFEELKKQVFPEIVKDRAPGLPIRIWVPGCSSGEEVYSIAISVLEFLGERVNYNPLQIFGTDLDEQAIDFARLGIFPETITQTVSDERLRLFFIKVEQGYQVNQRVRDCCIFSRHNVFRDPPFSKMDLISCRNLLIYMGPVLQKKVLQILHFALNPHGFLLLGASETIGRFADLFALVDKKQKIYFKKSTQLSPALRVEKMASAMPAGAGDDRHAKWAAQTWTNFDLQREVDRMLLRKFAPPGVVVNDDLVILQFRGHTGPYLEPAPGEASLKLLKMAHTGLVTDLSNMVKQVLQTNSSVRREGIKIYNADGSKYLTLEVDPIRVPPGTGRYLLITIQEMASPPEHAELLPPVEPAPGEEDAELLRLRQELTASKEYLQSIIEQQEATNEELTSANEEIQASNEELQSINEELETAKEELQSTNEELRTVNDELEARNEELEQVNNDLGNLLGGLSSAIVMVDKGLRIRRYTAEAEKLLNLYPADRGRLFTRIKPTVLIPDLEQRLQRVIDAMRAEDLEVQDTEGRWYEVKLRPYKTGDNKIDGAVLAYIDINEIKTSLEQTRRSRDFAQAIVSALRYPLLVLDKNLQVVLASSMFYELFQVNKEQTVGNLVYRLGNGQWGIPRLRELLEKTLHSGSGFDDYVVEHIFETIGCKVMAVSGRVITQCVADAPMVLMQIEDMTGKPEHEIQG